MDLLQKNEFESSPSFLDALNQLENEYKETPTNDDLIDVLEQIESTDKYVQNVLDQQNKTSIIFHSENLFQNIKKVLPTIQAKSNLENNLTIFDDRIETKEKGLEISIYRNVDTEFNAFSLDGKLLFDTLSNLPNQPITFYVDYDREGVEILSDNGRYAFELNELQTNKKIQLQNTFEIKAKYFVPLLKKLTYFVSKNEMSNQQSVHISYADGVIKYFATDGLIMKHTQELVELDCEPFEFLLPTNAIEALYRLVSDSEENLEVSFDSKLISISGKEFTLTSSLDFYSLEKYQYHKIGFQFESNAITVNRKLLLDSLRLGLIYSNKEQKMIYLQFFGEYNRLELKSRDLEFGNESSQFLPATAEGYLNNELMALNINQLENILKRFESEEVDLTINSKVLKVSDSTVDSELEFAVIAKQRIEEYKTSMF